MTYAMTLDNSWEIMDEEEMYDVNGGWGLFNSVAEWIDTQAWITIASAVNLIAWTVGLTVKYSGTVLKAIITGSSYLWAGVKVAFVAIKGFVLSNPILSASIAAGVSGFIAGYLVGRS